MYFSFPAILRVDHSVVDLETIEALYENVGMRRDSARTNTLKSVQLSSLNSFTFRRQRVQPDELERIKKHYETSAEDDVKLLDKPEQSVSEINKRASSFREIF